MGRGGGGGALPSQSDLLPQRLGGPEQAKCLPEAQMSRARH